MKTRIIGNFMMGLLLGMPVVGWAAEGSVTQGSATQGPPTTVVMRLLDSVRSYKKDSPELSAQGKAANSQAQKVAEETLAVKELAQRVLGSEWTKLKANQQKEFTQLLTSLFQKIAYPKSAEFFGDLQIEFRNEKIAGAEAVVETVVSHPKEGQIDISYQLRQINNKWMIEDVLLDGVSLLANVRSQIQQVIAKESYQGLMKRMREKLAES
jgi:phospholipid transport system substrate-binding protein